MSIVNHKEGNIGPGFLSLKCGPGAAKLAINICTDCCTFLLEVVAADIVGPSRDGLNSQRSCQAVGVHVVEGLDHVSDLRSEVCLNI